MVGSGVLSLPCGVAAFSQNPKALIPATVLLVIATLLSAYGFVLIGRACQETEATSFGSAWDRSLERGGWMPQLACILECLGGSVIYAMILGDVFHALVQDIAVLPAFLHARSNIIVTVGVLLLYPLCCLTSFAPLAKFSLLGTIASSFIVVVMGKRCLDGSYGPGGAFASSLPRGPPALDPTSPWLLSAQSLFLVSIMSKAYLVHFNAPQMYKEMEPAGRLTDASEVKRKGRNFATVAFIGFSIAACQYLLCMIFGFLTFGRYIQGNVLNNYAITDRWAVAARAALGISMLFGYPMQFAGFRSGVLEMLGVELPTFKLRAVTGAFLAAILGTACVVRNVGKVQAVEGALLAAFLIYVAPALMEWRFRKGLAARVKLGTIIALGAAAGAVGVVVSLAA